MKTGKIAHAAWWLIASGLLGAYVLLIWQFDQLPYLDLPNHLTRAYIIGKLLNGDPEYLANFSFQFYAKPYLLGDLLLTSIVAGLPISLSEAGRFWLSLCYLSLPIGSLVYARTIGSAKHFQILLLICTSFLATHWFFLCSFANFSLGSGLLFMVLSAHERWLQKRTGLRFALFVSLVLLSYFLHLSTFLFSGTAVAIITFSRWGFREIDFKQLVIAGAPYVPFCILRVVTTYGEDASWKFRTLFDKFIALGGMSFRFFAAIDIFLIFAYLTLLLLLFVGIRRKIDLGEANRKKTVEFGFLIAALLLWYLALPVEVGPAYDIDNRALPFIAVFLLFFCFYAGKRSADKIGAFNVSAVLLAVINFGYLYHFLGKHNDFLASYNQAVAQIPAGYKVLPVATRFDEGRMQSNLHTAELYMTNSPPGFVPFVFSSNNAAGIIDYFSYKNHPYGPDEKWYLDGTEFDWKRAKDEYDFIIVSRPFDDERIELSSTQQFYKNRAAIVFDLREHGE